MSAGVFVCFDYFIPSFKLQHRPPNKPHKKLWIICTSSYCWGIIWLLLWPLAYKVHSSGGSNNKFNPFCIIRMSPEFLSCFCFLCHFTLKFFLASSLTGCDLWLKPLDSHTSTYTHTYTKLKLWFPPLCNISLPVSAQSPTGNDVHREMCTDIKCSSETHQ